MAAWQVICLISASFLHYQSHGQAEDEIIMMEIERQTLGKHPVLGQLYSAHSDKLLHGFSFWYTDEVENNKIKIWHPWQDTHIQQEHSLEDDLNLLEVEAQLAASFKAGMIKIRGAASYLGREETKEDQSSVVFTYKSRSRTESISPNLTQNLQIDVCSKDNPVHKLSQDYVPTHMVSAITYGGDVHFVYTKESSTDQSIMDVFGSLSIDIKLKVTEISGDAKVNYTTEDNESYDKLQIEMFSDFIVPVQPTTLEETIEIYKNVAENFGSKDQMYETSVPMSMELIPITAFCQDGGLAAEISDSILTEATDIRLTLKEVLRKINRLLESTPAKMNFLVRSLLLDFRTEISKYTLNYERKLQKSIVNARNPNSQQNESAIVALMEEYQNSHFAYDKYVYPYLTEKERQVRAINIFYDETLYQNEPEIAVYRKADIPRAIITRLVLFLLTLNVLPNVDSEKFASYGNNIGRLSRFMWYNNKTKVGEIGELWRDYLNFFDYNNYEAGFSFFVETAEGRSCSDTLEENADVSDANKEIVDISIYDKGKIVDDAHQMKFKNLVQTAPDIFACRIANEKSIKVEWNSPTFNQDSSLGINNVLIYFKQSTSRANLLYPYETRRLTENLDEACNGWRCKMTIPDIHNVFSYNISLAFNSKYGQGKLSKVIKLDGDFDKMMKTPGCILESDYKFENLVYPGKEINALHCAAESQGHWSYEIGSGLCYKVQGNSSRKISAEGWAVGTGCRSSNVDSAGVCLGTERTTTSTTTSTTEPTTTRPTTTTTPTLPVVLQGGTASNEGNVYVTNGQEYFGPVCDDDWSDIDAKVVCRQLGLFGGTATMSSHFGIVPPPFAMTSANCQGDELKIQHCPHDTNSFCGEHEGAGVICLAEPPALEYKFTNDYEWVWDDSGTGGYNDGSFWRAQQVDGYCSIGDVAVNNHQTPAFNTVLVKSQKSGILVPPTGFNWVWTDSGSGGDHDVAIYTMIAPDNFYCLGAVTMPDYYSLPDANRYCCVHMDYVVWRSTEWIYDDSGTGADYDLTIYRSVRGDDPSGIEAGNFKSNDPYGLLLKDINA